MLMRHTEHGWHNASDLEREDMKKNGWIESSDAEYQEVIKKKLALTTKDDTIEPQEAPKAKLGRPSKLSILGGSNEHNSANFKSKP